MTPGTVNGMNALIQKSTTTSLLGAGTGSGSGSGSEAPPATQHWTSLGPGQLRVTKVPEQADPGLLRHVPASPLALVHDLLKQHLTPAGSFGQRLLIVKPAI